VVNSAIAEGMTVNGDVITDISDDPMDTTDVDIDGDGDGEDTTVITIITVEPPVEDEVVVFTGISPNGDGMNDFWEIQGIENFPNNKVRLFNRWGVEVFGAKGYGEGDRVFRGFSDGRTTISQDELLPVGTYYYVIEYVNDENKTI
jgi:gliding motility-associated-like protein